MDPFSISATLLILTSREEDAAGLINSLRNGGLAVSANVTREPERLEQLISTNQFELILCCEYDPAIDLGTCMSRYRELNTDIPLVVISDKATESPVLIDALRAGARDLTKRRETDHLQLVVARELADFHHRRSEDLLRARLTECEERSRELIGASGEAVALIQRGIHLLVNPTYSELYGFDTSNALEGFPLLDLIAADFKEPVRESLRRAEQQVQKGPAELDVQCTRTGGERFEARLTVSPSKLDGEPCVRIVAEARTPLIARSQPSSLDPDTVCPDFAHSAQKPQPGPGPSNVSRTAEGGLDEPEERQGHGSAARIGHAPEVDGFQLVYQPIVSLRGDSQESYDVRLRLPDDDGTLREAEDFLDAASQSGQMVTIDRWVIRNAVATVAARHAEGEKINFFVNVSEEALQEKDLLIWICDCLREFQARGNWLTLQFQENHAHRHADAFAKLSAGLQKVRCRVALNRFGDGPHPELLLRGVHLDYVKLLPDLGQGLAEDKSKQQRLQELTKLTREANAKCVVTGVEDALSLTVLWTAGVDYVQGNFVQKPSTTLVLRQGGFD